MADIPAAVEPVDAGWIEEHVVRVARVTRIEGRRPIVAVSYDIVKAGVVPTTGSRKKYPIIFVTGLI